jgi:hypothetical protein
MLRAIRRSPLFAAAEIVNFWRRGIPLLASPRASVKNRAAVNIRAQEVRNMGKPDADVHFELTSEPAEPIASENVFAASQPYIGRWNRLVSTTNWEKGRIIHQWRDALAASEAPPTDYSDEAWARLVGGVTGQHAGRLRRTFRRFGDAYAQYEGLYWSHFQAALEWDDAEMWLEGAVQNKWSVSQMRRSRWETLGGDQQSEPRDEEVQASELDEDFEPALNRDPDEPPRSEGSEAVQAGPRHEGPDFGDDDADGEPQSTSHARERDGAEIYAGDEEPTIRFVRPFENLADLPDDLAEAFESFKLAILRHKTDDWRQISRDDVLASLDALKELALAPSAEGAPF